ncbi:hypothetical protein T11_9663 [Trichinella zimbabwensis]|uniref:Uncharacterized protein n=1 Tax=Trichinella zimbabwensis TaxID=268475 RepID=A0A0V1GVR3_9BILA|nr:hypothetical protein T11_9663 [Trichinella zimbabwensis]
MCSKEKFTGSSALSRSISENTLVDALHKVSAVVRIKVQQHSTSNKHLDIVHGLEALETPPEAYQAFLMPMTLPRLPRELTMKWKRGRTDEKNSLKELLTFLKAEIRIRERYGSFDSSARVDSEIQACIIKELYKATLHRARSLHIENGNLNNAPAMNFLHTESGDSSMAKTTMAREPAITKTRFFANQ